MIELLTNPWVIIVIVLSVLIGNIAALKYTAKLKFPLKKPDQTSSSTEESESTEQQKTDKP
ncbi:DUF2897 family protein [Vibrio sp. NTOU-M3]|uniref:DUF2897 family protein n=1 Tax=Vibrio sp. NTOU-M3 TaxID=3234954 RepID=UPI00349FA642